MKIKVYLSDEGYGHVVRQEAIIKELFKSIPEGQEIEKLKSKQTEAIDYIMGYDQQAELLSGLSNVLHGSGVMMLQEYKENN